LLFLIASNNIQNQSRTHAGDPVQEISTTEALREQLSEWRHAGDHIALVPTMGSLHEGHLSLVRLARRHAERVVVSIFVNPTQFGEGEDYQEYPRSMEADRRKLKRLNVDLLFAPDVETMYPLGVDNATSVTVPVLTEELCGAFRPGHFDGVTTVVSRLFSLVQPDVAVFGQKDYQQQHVILSLPIEIICAPTQREDDGLAMSSRNQYLSEEERAIAPNLYAVINRVGGDLESGKKSYRKLENGALAELKKLGFEPDYVSIRRAENLDEPDRENDQLVVLAAARLGDARLIDNVIVHV
jgi:pantoate--beta-alanine ligase